MIQCSDHEIGNKRCNQAIHPSQTGGELA